MGVFRKNATLERTVEEHKMADEKKKARQYTNAERAAVLARIGAGERQVDIARELGIPASTIRVWVQRAGDSTDPLQQPTYAELMAHNQTLRADLSRQQEEIDLLKKALAYSTNHGRTLTVADKTELVVEYAGSLSISRRCEVLGLERSTYYRHQPHVKALEPEKWAAERIAIRSHHAAVHRRCGRRDMHSWLRRQGFTIGYGKTHDLMQQEGLRAMRGRRKGKVPKAQGINNEAVHIRNLLWDYGQPCNFTSPAPGRCLVGDSTQIVWERRGMSLHLHVVMDLYNRAVVGWAASTRPDALSAIAAMEMARHRGAITAGTIFHSDHGSQYMSNAFRDYCQSHGVRQSMGERRSCSDNAVVESFFATLKGDLPDLKPTFPTPRDLAIWLQDYIEAWYNRKRPHRWNNGQPPMRRQAENVSPHSGTNP